MWSEKFGVVVGFFLICKMLVVLAPGKMIWLASGANTVTIRTFGKPREA